VEFGSVDNKAVHVRIADVGVRLGLKAPFDLGELVFQHRELHPDVVLRGGADV
jgi:hypothetical protein